MARFYVNRGGGRVPEGPFEEEQIILLILAGKVRSGHVSSVGSQRFFPLAGHPPFARALADAGVAPDPTATAPRASLGTKNTSRGLLLGAVLSIFGLALAAVAIGTYVMFSVGGMPIRAAVPMDTELLVEVRSVPTLLADLRRVRAVDAARFLNAHSLDDAALALTGSFRLPTPLAKKLISSASSLGVAGRKLAGAAEGGVLLSFSDAAPVNVLFSTSRFKYTGLVAKSGRRYMLSAGAPAPSTNVDQTRRSLDALSLGAGDTGIFWFETSKILFIGSASFAESVARAVSLDMPSLEQAPGFKAAQQALGNKPNVSGYFDAAKLATVSDPKIKAFIDGDLGRLEPVSASLELVPAGALTRFLVQAKVDAGSPESTVHAARLSVIDRLPAETFAYAAAVTKADLSGAELEKRLLGQIAAADPAAAERASAVLAGAEQRLHLQLSETLGAIGDQGALAVLAPADYSLALGEPQQMLSTLAVVYAQALKDEAPARAACKALQTELGASPGAFSLKADADGYFLTSSDGTLGAQLRVSNGYLFAAAGSPTLVDRAWRAFSRGENTLVTEPAQRAARAALPSTAQLAVWIDAGRIGDAIQKNPILAMGFRGVDLSAVHWTGPDRVTAALTISSERKAGLDTYRIEALNLPVFAGLLALP
jgi:hypothetical protein